MASCTCGLTVVLCRYLLTELSWCVYEMESAWIYESVRMRNKMQADTHHVLPGSGCDEDQVSSIGLGHLEQLLFGRVRKQPTERGFQWTICPYWSHTHLLYDTQQWSSISSTGPYSISIDSIGHKLLSNHQSREHCGLVSQTQMKPRPGLKRIALENHLWRCDLVQAKNTSSKFTYHL